MVNDSGPHSFVSPREYGRRLHRRCRSNQTGQSTGEECPCRKGSRTTAKVANRASLPCNGPLLQRNHSAANVMVRDLGLVQRNTRRSETDRYPRNDPTDNKHSTVLRGTLEDGTNNPNPGRDHDRWPPSQDVCQLCNQESSKEGACRHGRDDGTLSVGSWEAERPFVCLILGEGSEVNGGDVLTVRVEEDRHSRHRT